MGVADPGEGGEAPAMPGGAGGLVAACAAAGEVCGAIAASCCACHRLLRPCLVHPPLVAVWLLLLTVCPMAEGVVKVLLA